MKRLCRVGSHSFELHKSSVIQIPKITSFWCALTMHISTTYRIAGNFQGRKLSWISEKYDFHGLLTFAVPKDTMLPNFTEKTFAKLRNSRKYSPSKVSRYTVCVQEFFHSTTDTVRVGLNVMIMEAVKWLMGWGMWENFWHHFYQRSQSLECDFKALSCTPTQYWMFATHEQGLLLFYWLSRFPNRSSHCGIQ